jgi:hypothetical protein
MRCTVATGWLRAIFLSETPNRTSVEEISRHVAAPNLRQKNAALKTFEENLGILEACY